MIFASKKIYQSLICVTSCSTQFSNTWNGNFYFGNPRAMNIGNHCVDYCRSSFLPSALLAFWKPLSRAFAFWKLVILFFNFKDHWYAKISFWEPLCHKLRKSQSQFTFWGIWIFGNQLCCKFWLAIFKKSILGITENVEGEMEYSALTVQL